MAKIRWLYPLIFLISPLACLAGKDKSHSNWKLLNPAGCGMSSSDRIVGGTEAPMGAYPWIARLGYTPRNASWKKADYACGGAVINKFYIITAAHCALGLPEDLALSRIRLGEYNTETDPDCEDLTCNDPYKEYEVDEIIGHEEWNITTLKNDITLLRVKEEIQFTNFIRPICMVKGKLLKQNYVGKIAELAGWGDIDSSGKKSNILQTAKLTIRPVSRCNRNKLFGMLTVDYRQLCAGGTKGLDSCNGDSGGPLMRVEAGVEPGSPRYFIIGLVSFGVKNCGDSAAPGVYTNLSKYLLWILDHLRP